MVSQSMRRGVGAALGLVVVALATAGSLSAAGVTGASLVSTVAGTGVAGFSGDGGPANAAQLSAPRAVATDLHGNVYAVDAGNHRVRRIDAVTGVITTVAGTGVAGFSGDNGPATAAMLNDPFGITLDAAGNLYISDTRNNRVRRVDALTGVITTIAGMGLTFPVGDGGSPLAAALRSPGAIVFDCAGNLYIAADARVRRIDGTTGIISTFAGTGNAGPLTDNVPATTSHIPDIRGLAADADRNIYIAGHAHDAIRKVGPDGIIRTVAGNATDGYSGDGGPATAAQLSSVNGLALDGDGNLWLSDVQRVRMVDAATGNISTVVNAAGFGFNGDGLPAAASGLGFVAGIAFDRFGSLLIADFSHRIRRVQGVADVPGDVTAASIIHTYAGTGIQGFSGDGVPANATQVNVPFALATDRAGNLFIADALNHRVRRVDAVTGIIATVAGNGVPGYAGDDGPAVDASLNEPQGVAVDAQGNLYIGEFWNHRVRRVDAATGIITTYAGDGQDVESGDGGAATDASIRRVRAVEIDCAGNVYVASARRVRRIDARTGIITTVAGSGLAGPLLSGVPATAANVDPSDLAVDCTGTVYFTDNLFNAVRRVTRGMIDTVAGGNGAGFFGDGGPATAAALNGPGDVAIDARGNLWIADTSNFRIRRIDLTTGLIDTVVNRNGICCLPGGEGVPAANAITGPPFSVAFAPEGHLYVGDFSRVRRVRILDIVAPVFTSPADIVAEATGPAGAAVVFNATALDDVNGVIGAVCVPASGSTFPLGTTQVNCTATDGAGNSDSGSFLVTVRDTTPPLVGVFGNEVVQAFSIAGAEAFFSPFAIDVVNGEFAPVCDLIADRGDGIWTGFFPLGTTTITCWATDAAGNTGSTTHNILVVPGIQFPLHVQAKNYTRVRGYADVYDETFSFPVPGMTATVTGLADGDWPFIVVSAETDATIDSPAGQYRVVPVIADPFGVLAKYEITFVNGVMTVHNPQPYIYDTDPRSIVKGAPETVVRITGSDFLPSAPGVEGTTVYWNGEPVPFTFISREAIDVTVSAERLAERGVALIAVVNGPPLGGTSEFAFSITDAPVMVDQPTVARTLEPGQFSFFLWNQTTFQPALIVDVDATGPGVVTAGLFSGNPGPPFAAGSRFFDVHVDPASAFASLTIHACDLGGEKKVSWFNGAGWELVSDQKYVEATEFMPPCVRIFVDGTTSPSLGDLNGTYFAATREGMIGKMAGNGRVFDGPTKVTFYQKAYVRSDGSTSSYLLLQVCRHDGVKCKGAPKKFLATTWDELMFTNDPGVTPSAKPAWAEIADTVTFAGTGSYQNMPGYSYTAKVVDAGDGSGVGVDRFEVTVVAPDGTTLFSVAGTLVEGNLEATPGK